MQELTHSQYIDQNLEIIANQSKLGKQDLEFFALQCKRTGLDPITRQIYAIPQAGKITIMASIDGLRLIAERSGAYEGQTSPQWCGDDGVWKDIWINKQPPTACKVGVYKKNFKEPAYGVALFNEYAGRNRDGSLTFMWGKMPSLMIAKVAESLALRKAFPNEMSGILGSEEMDQAQNEIKDIKPAAQQLAEAKESIQPENKTLTAADYVVKIGKYKGMKLSELKDFEVEGYAKWLRGQSKEKGQPLMGGSLEFCEMADLYLQELKVVEKEMIEEIIPI